MLADKSRPRALWDNVSTNPLSHSTNEAYSLPAQPIPVSNQMRFSLEKLRESFQFGGPPAFDEAIDSVGIDAELQSRISTQMRDFFDFFKGLWESDQAEISSLSAQLNLNKQEVKRLRTSKAALEQKLTEAEAAASEAREEAKDVKATQSAASASTFASASVSDVPFSPVPAGAVDFARALTWTRVAETISLPHLPPLNPTPPPGRVSDDTAPSLDALDRLADRDPSKKLLSSILKGSFARDKALKEAASSVGASHDPLHQLSRVNGVAEEEEEEDGEDGDRREGGKSHNIIFLPPHLLTTNPMIKWPAYFYSNYKRNPIWWLGIFWLFMFLLSIGLLVGLLVPWSTINGSPSPSPPPQSYLSQGTLRSFTPGPNYFSFLTSSPRPRDSIYYLVVPLSSLQGNVSSLTPLVQTLAPFSLKPTSQLITASSIITLVDKGLGTSALINASVACGVRQLQGVNISYLVSIETFSAYNLECVSLRVAAAKSSTSSSTSSTTVQGTGNCLTCPYLEPGVSYVLVSASSDGKVGTLGLLFLASSSSGGGDGGEVPALPAPHPPPPPPLPLPPSLTPPTPPQPSPPSPGSPLDPNSPSRAPNFIPTPTPSPQPAANPSVTAMSESSISLRFQVDGPGRINYAILAATSFFFQGGLVASYPSPPPTLPINGSSSSSPTGGVLAFGSINVRRRPQPFSTTQPYGGVFSCTIGLDDGTSPCSCGQALDFNPCVIPAPCTGDLCSVSLYALAPATSYVIWVNTQSEDGSSFSETLSLPPFTTYPPSLPASLSPAASSPSSTGAGLNSTSIGPDSFAIDSVGQDKIGFVYLLVTRPNNQSSSLQLTDGTSSPFIRELEPVLAGGRRRQMSTTSDISGTTNQTDYGPAHFGFIPLLVDDPASSLSPLIPSQCAVQKPCDLNWLTSTFLLPDEALVVQDCLAITNISQRGSFLATGLAQGAVYNARLISTDAYYNFALYSSVIKTLDLSPPSFIDINVVVFSTNLTVGLTLDRPSEVYGYLIIQSAVDDVTVTTIWPPSLQGPVSSAKYCKSDLGPDSDPSLTPTWSCLLTFTDPGTVLPDRDYNIILIASSLKGIPQSNFTLSSVIHTDDLPFAPQWLNTSVDGSNGFNASLTFQLDKPSQVYYLLDLSSSFTGGSCPSAGVIFSGGGDREGGGLAQSPTLIAQSPTLIVAGPFSISSTQPSTLILPPPSSSTQQLIGGQSYLLCLVANGITPPSTRQSVALSLSFNTTDRTPPRFIQLTANSTNTSISIFASLDKPRSVISCLLLSSPSTPPSPSSIFALASGSSSSSSSLRPASYGTFIAVQANVTAQGVAQGLQPGVSYDVYCVATDKVGNKMTSVSTISGITTLAPLIFPTSVKLSLPTSSSSFVTSSSDGANLPPFNLPSSIGPLSILVNLSDGSIANLSSLTSSAAGVTAPKSIEVAFLLGGEVWCQLIQLPGNKYTIQGVSNGIGTGSCTPSIKLTYPNNLTLVGAGPVISFITMTSLKSKVQVQEAPIAGGADGGGWTGPTPLVLTLLKCDWTRYQPATFHYSASLTNCTSPPCPEYNLDASVNVTLDDPSVAIRAIQGNQGNGSSPSNLIVPLQPGVVSLSAQLGPSSLVTVLSVHDSFLPGWPRMAPISDTSILIQTNMTDFSGITSDFGGWTIGYRLVDSSTTAALNSTIPGPSEILGDGNFLDLTPYPEVVGPGFYSKQVDSLTPGTNYTVFLALSPYPLVYDSSDGNVSNVIVQGPYLPTTFVTSGILTLNQDPPSFTSISPITSPPASTPSSFLFSLQVSVDLDRPGSSLSFLVLPDLSCLNQSLVTTNLVLDSLSQEVLCGCDQPFQCLPLSGGQVDLGEDSLGSTLDIEGFQFLSPFEFLQPSTCSAVSPSYAQQDYWLYLVAWSPTPRYKDWLVSCNAPEASSPNTSALALSKSPYCDDAALAPCFASPPPSPPLPNIQSDPFLFLSSNQQLSSMSSRSKPVAISFNASRLSNQSLSFISSNITTSGLTLKLDFQVNQQALVFYSLDLTILGKDTLVANGTNPVVDPSKVNSVNISSWCAGVQLSAVRYTFTYWAVDVFGQATRQIRSNVTLTA